MEFWQTNNSVPDMSEAALSFVLVQVCLMQLLLFFPSVMASSFLKQNYERSVNTILGHVFEHTVVNTAVACCVACSRDQKCRGVSYYPDSGSCELNWWADGTVPTQFNAPGVNVYTKGSQCPVPWIMFEGHCYLFSTTARIWADSRDYCTGMGAQLVDIQSDAENTFVRDKAIDLAVVGLWLGIGDYWGTNTWTTGQSITYQDWYIADLPQPNGELANENCIAIFDGYRWWDRRCTDLYACSCKTVLF